jgi:hypothetical protein
MRNVSRFKSGFISLSEDEQEEAFGLSCYDIGDWEEGFDWLSQLDSVREDIRSYLRKISPDSYWGQLNRHDEKMEGAQDFFLTGQASNCFLAWYLEDAFDEVRARTESRGKKSEFDVVLSPGDIDMVGIEMKRVANSGQLTNYFREFPSKCEKRANTKYKMLIIYYPVNRDAASRAPSLVRGYNYLSAMTDSFFESDQVWVANIPATFPRDGGEIRPLEETKNLIEDRTDDVA